MCVDEGVWSVQCGLKVRCCFYSYVGEEALFCSYMRTCVFQGWWRRIWLRHNQQKHQSLVNTGQFNIELTNSY